MLAPICEQHLHLLSSVLDRRSDPLHRHQRNRRLAETFPSVSPRPRRVSELQASDRGDPYQTTIDPGLPCFDIGSLAELKPHERRLVEQPTRHRHASAITSGSARSAKISPARRQLSSVVVSSDRGVTPSSFLRRNSLRDSPN